MNHLSDGNTVSGMARVERSVVWMQDASQRCSWISTTRGKWSELRFPGRNSFSQPTHADVTSGGASTAASAWTLEGTTKT